MFSLSNLTNAAFVYSPHLLAEASVLDVVPPLPVFESHSYEFSFRKCPRNNREFYISLFVEAVLTFPRDVLLRKPRT